LVPTARPPVPLSSLGGRAGTPRALARETSEIEVVRAARLAGQHGSHFCRLALSSTREAGHWAADVRVAQGLIACLNINFAASRLAVIKDDRRIDCPSSPISVSE